MSSTIFMEKANDDEYKIHTSIPMKSTVVKFKPGVEFDEVTNDGSVARSLITFEGDNKLVHTQKRDKTVTIIREFSETDLVMTMQCETVEAKRYFKVIE
jgi:fatty acid-binding protein 3, muscle and heart